MYFNYYVFYTTLLLNALELNGLSSIITIETFITTDTVNEDLQDIKRFKLTWLKYTFKHNRLSDYIEIDDESAIFIFNFSDLETDWQKLIDGKYSQIDPKIKEKILNFFDKTSGNHIYMHSYLYPEKFFKRYAELLGVEESLLKSVGELCNKPDLEKEMLMIEVPDLENLKIIS